MKREATQRNKLVQNSEILTKQGLSLEDVASRMQEKLSQMQSASRNSILNAKRLKQINHNLQKSQERGWEID